MDDLIHHLQKYSVKKGEFLLSSGIKSNIYVDAKATLLTSRGAYLAGYEVWRMAPDGVHAYAGFGYGGALLVSAALAVNECCSSKPVRGIVIRDKPKTHGLGGGVCSAGFDDLDINTNPSVVLLEDVVSTGETCVQAINILRAQGCEVVSVIALVDRDLGGTEVITKTGVKYAALLQIGPGGALYRTGKT